MISQSREDWDVREIVDKLLHCGPQNVQVALSSLIPYVMRRKVSCPDDVVDVLRKKIC